MAPIHGAGSVAFVDIELASLRFSPKINFRARTNRIDFLPFLDAIAYPAENHFNEAMRAMSQRSRQCIPRGTRRGLFLGQSQLDLSARIPQMNGASDQ